MRSVSAAALAKLTQQKGGEPLNIVQINWTRGLTRFYADRAIPEFKIEGKILSMGELENVVNVSQNTNSQSVSLTLDDDDLVLKHIYDRNDIHKRPCLIYQWFSGLHFADRFLIFEGEISSPIIWKEGDRTLSFDIVSKVEDKEIGYSPEEGTYASIPDNLIGQAWPLPFGTVLKVPTQRLDEIPAGATLDSNLVEDFSIGKQISELTLKIQELGGLASLAFSYAILMYYNSHFDANGTYQLERQDDQFESMGDQYTDQGNQYLEQQWQAQQDIANLGAESARQGKMKKSSMRVNGGSCFPQGQSMNVDIGGVKHTGSFAGDNFQVSKAEHPKQGDSANSPQTTTIKLTSSIGVGGRERVEKAGFFYVPPGNVIKILQDLPIRYIVAMLPVSVLNVWAYKNYGDTRIMTQVPPNFYSVGIVNFGAVVATQVTLFRPLSHQEQGWSDDIFVDMQSPVGPNTADILTWLIVTYTDLGIDAASFNYVRARLSGFPSNFCLFDRKNIVEILQEISYQARCAIWLKNGIFYLRYLPDEPAAVDTITLNDIIVESFEIGHTSTEEIVTKLVASYKISYDQDRDYKFILRNNVPKYGTQQDETDWYSYTDARAVDIAATFWLIRKSNTWKVLKFKTPIHKIRLETFDPVNINLAPRNWAMNGVVKGIIQSTQLDTDTLTISFEVWIPVRLGEMSKFRFAWPIDSATLVYPQEVTLAGSGGPGEQTGGDLSPGNNNCNNRVKFEKSPKRQRVHNGSQNPGLTTYLDGSGTAIVRPGIGNSEPIIYPSSDYQFRDYATNPIAAPVDAQPGVVPGKIESGDGPGYTITTYPKGLDGQTKTVSAKIMDKTQKASPGDWVLVVTLVFSDQASPSVTNGSTTSQQSPPANKIERVFVPVGGKPGCYAGKVTGGGGSTYTVDVYKKGLGADPESVDGVKQLQIAGGDSVPADTWCIVGEAKNEQGLPSYFMQVPVWVE